jgi:hypothetical protein
MNMADRGWLRTFFAVPLSGMRSGTYEGCVSVVLEECQAKDQLQRPFRDSL